MHTGNLPKSYQVNVGAMEGIFSNVTNSYKFFWLTSMLDRVQDCGLRTISTHWLLCRMVARAWYPVNYLRLHLGKSDMLSQVASLVMTESGLSIDANVSDVTTVCLNLQSSSRARKELIRIGRYVPYRFIRPFFMSEIQTLTDHAVNNRIIELASNSFHDQNASIYRFIGDNIEITEAWFQYMSEHVEVLRDFCNGNFVLYLESKNPNV